MGHTRTIEGNIFDQERHLIVNSKLGPTRPLWDRGDALIDRSKLVMTTSDGRQITLEGSTEVLAHVQSYLSEVPYWDIEETGDDGHVMTVEVRVVKSKLIQPETDYTRW